MSTVSRSAPTASGWPPAAATTPSALSTSPAVRKSPSCAATPTTSTPSPGAPTAPGWSPDPATSRCASGTRCRRPTGPNGPPPTGPKKRSDGSRRPTASDASHAGKTRESVVERMQRHHHPCIDQLAVERAGFIGDLHSLACLAPAEQRMSRRGKRGIRGILRV